MTKTQIALDREVETFFKERFSPSLRGGAIIQKKLEVDETKRQVDGVISTESVDRDQEVVMSRGLDLDGYRSNPIVLFMHDPYAMIGKCVDGPTVRRRKGVNEVVACTQFAETGLANEVFGLVEGEFMRGISVGMRPRTMEVSPPTPGEIRKRPELAEARRLIRSAELIEYSFVSVPANADALTTAVSKGLIKLTEPYLERFVRVVTDAAPRKKAIVRVVPQVRVATLIKKVADPPDVRSALKDARIYRAVKAGRM
jgi:hypothetical protein